MSRCKDVVQLTWKKWLWIYDVIYGARFFCSSVYWRSLCFNLMNASNLQFHPLFNKNLAFHVQVSYSLSITRESDTLIIILWISQYSQTILLIQIPIKMLWRVILILCLLRTTSPKKNTCSFGKCPNWGWPSFGQLLTVILPTINVCYNNCEVVEPISPSETSLITKANFCYQNYWTITKQKWHIVV